MPGVLISGASRGLGLEFVRQYLDDNWSVVALCRDPGGATELQELSSTHDALDVLECDVTDFSAIDDVAAALEGRPLDVLVNNAGLFGPKREADGDFRQSFGHLDYDVVTEVLRVNTLAPLKLCETLVDNVTRSEQKKMVTISSALGSIANTDTGLYAYRTSKAAVNMAMATLARELAPRGAIVAVLNPGWVKTDMGGAHAALEIADSIRSLRRVIADLSPAQNGRFLDYDGSEIPW